MSDELCRKCETEEIKRYVNPVLKTNGPDVLATNGKVKFKAEEIELIEHHKGKYVLYADHITQVEKARREALEEAAKHLEMHAREYDAEGDELGRNVAMLYARQIRNKK